jgi:hypothetical protein
MKPALLFLSCVIALVAQGQLAVINDPDGFTNVRAGKGVSTKITGKFFNGDVFLYNEDDKTAEWIQVFYNPEKSVSTHDMQGYIHRDRLMPVDRLKHISMASANRTLQNGRLMMHNDSVTVVLNTIPFQEKQHLVHKDSNGLVEKINGRQPIGTDGGMPGKKLTAISVAINGRSVIIPANAWNDVYEPNLRTCNVFFDTATGFMYIYIPDSSDGAGAYSIAWVFRNGQYVKRYFDSF